MGHHLRAATGNLYDGNIAEATPAPRSAAGHQHRPQPWAENHPVLHYLLTGHQVDFCRTAEEYRYHHRPPPPGMVHSVPEYATRLHGPTGATGIVRARVNRTGHAPSAIIRPVADRLGLQRHPLRGPGAVSVWGMGNPAPLEVLTEPLTVQLLSWPNNIAMEVTLPVVVVVPSSAPPGDELFELQLGALDFCAAFLAVPAPPCANRFIHLESRRQYVVPLVAPKLSRFVGTSSFNVLEETYEEIVELTLARQAVVARRAAAAAAAAGGAEGSLGPTPAQAAAEAMLQARHVMAPGASVGTSVTPAAAAIVDRPVAGSREWVDEWAPQTLQRRQRGSGQHAQNARRRGRGRRGGGAGSRASNEPRSPAHASHQAAETDDLETYQQPAVVTGTTTDAEGAAAAMSDVYAGLDPLPSGLTASHWSEVAATSLPLGDDSCSICIEDFTDELEGGVVRLVTQLRCRHTFCVLCLLQFISNRTFNRRPLQCPQCRTEV